MKNQNLFFVVILSCFLMLSISFVYAQESNIFELTPTDDAYVLADLTDPADVNELRKINSGDLDHLKIGYAINTTATSNQNLSIALLKFDLSNLSEDQIDSATLQLYADQIQLSTPQDIGVFFVNGSEWDESTITYENMPPFYDLLSTTRIDSIHYHQWEIGDVIKQNAGKPLTLMISFVHLLPNTEDVIIFASKDSSPEFYPTLIINTSTINDDPNIVNVMPSDDTFIGLDLTNPDDVYNLRNSNYGDVDFIKVWYSNNATSLQERITTSGLLKFDLSEINLDDVKTAQLKMKTLLVDSTGTDKMLSISKLNSTNWNELDLTFANRPTFELSDPILTKITQPNFWHSWDVTSLVKNNEYSELALSVSFDRVFPGHEEQTVFYSKESDFSPYLEITLNEKEGGGCLIATATFGSELAPQVQQLRELRDNHLLQTESGSAFMSGFNQFYYSFSPYIADLERENPLFKETVKLSLTPLLTSLSILNYVNMDSEESVLGYGISLILFNVGMYFAAPMALFWNIKNNIKKN